MDSGPDAPANVPRLTWRARRGVRISVATPLPESGFQASDLLTPNTDAGLAPGTQQTLLDAAVTVAPVAQVVSITGFKAMPDTRPLVFTLVVSLAELPHPVATEFDGAGVTLHELPAGPGIRIQRVVAVEAAAADWPAFSATYLVQTDAGVLSLAFATPHLDAAIEFAELFDSLAASATLTVR